MQTGFRQLPVDIAFARRSARYLASQGYPPSHIHAALMEQLDITDADADQVLSVVAA